MLKSTLASLPGARQIGAAALIASTFCGVNTLGAQVILEDQFDGIEVDTTTWTAGSTGSQGLYDMLGGSLTFDTGSTTANARAAIITNSTEFSPWVRPIKMTLSGLSIDAVPATNGNSSFYAFVGRLETDSGGPADGAKAATYSAGSPGYGSGGAFGFSLIEYSNEVYRVQFLSSGDTKLTNTVVNVTGYPTQVELTLDGENDTWMMELTGATFTTLATANSHNVAISADGTTVTGDFMVFQESAVRLGGDSIARFGIGVFNGSLAPQEAINATIGSVTVEEADPIVTTYTSIFAEYPIEYDVRDTELGYVFDAFYPWVFFYAGDSWAYVEPETATASSFYMYDMGLQAWLWTTVDFEGWYYNYATSAWGWR